MVRDVAIADREPHGLVEEGARLRALVVSHLERQGFRLTEKGVIAPVAADKASLRGLHEEAVNAQRERARGALHPREHELITHLATGRALDPASIQPRLVPLEHHRSLPAVLWRWCSLHWSIPVSGGYGRRLRFLVVDEAHDDAVIGLIGLADPVFALGCRDDAVGWTHEQRMDRLTSVMDAFVLGAVPPYSDLLGGKLIAALVSTREVRDAFDAKYGHRTTLIAQRDPRARLALVTTASALGRSSVYNRLRRADGSPTMTAVGYTQGSGDFHFSGSIYDELATFAARHRALSSEWTAQRHERWGASAFRNRREVIQTALAGLGLPTRALRFHGVRRQIFLAPTAHDSYAFLRGESDDLTYFRDDVASVSKHWRTRWALPRSERTDAWRAFEPSSWRLYG